MNKRKALVLGNSKYQVKPLRNPINDANSITEILHDKGFDVTIKKI
ncbi:caspase family protein [Shewanella corallii]